MREKESANWTPRIGQEVKAMREKSFFYDRVGIVIRGDGKHAESYLVKFFDGLGWYTAKELQPVQDAAKGGEA